MPGNYYIVKAKTIFQSDLSGGRSRVRRGGDNNWWAGCWSLLCFSLHLEIKSLSVLCQGEKNSFMLESHFSQDKLTGKGWCSTLTDKSGYHISGKGSWGECNPVTSAGGQ